MFAHTGATRAVIAVWGVAESLWSVCTVLLCCGVHSARSLYGHSAHGTARWGMDHTVELYGLDRANLLDDLAPCIRVHVPYLWECVCSIKAVSSGVCPEVSPV